MEDLQIPILETERLRLRRLRGSDFEDYAALNADPEIQRHRGQGPVPWDRGRSWRHLAFLVGHWQLGRPGMWAVEHREAGVFLGVVGYAEPEDWPGFELAGVLARRFWGHGYATEAAWAALDYAFNVLEKERVISLVAPENRASIRVVARLGERLEGRIQHYGREMLCFSIDRESYDRRQKKVRPAALIAS
jgi:RimJ/RimL family protein N-acetyltransferase